MEKVDIVPRTLLKFSMDSELLKSSLELVSQEEFIRSDVNQMSKNHFLLREKKYKKLSEWVDSCLEEIRLYMNYRCESLKVTQSWANLTKKNQFHHPHVHPNSILSGIIYLTKSNASTLFGFKDDWYIMTDYDSHPSVKLSFDKERSSSMSRYNVIPGDMILFPSNYRHSTEIHQIDEYDRITISFNVFPNGKLGFYGLLSGLEIEVK